MLQAGFARCDITPPLGTHMAGYYNDRQASGVRDPLLGTCVAFRDGGGNTALVYSLDLLQICQEYADEIRRVIAGMTGVPEDAVFVACTHIHTGPLMWTKMYPHNPTYNAWLYPKLASLGCAAIGDLASAGLRTAEGVPGYGRIPEDRWFVADSIIAGLI